MTNSDDVWRLLRDQVAAREAVACPLDQAFGRVLREDVKAPEDQPAFDRSAVDGFAVRSGDTSESFRIVGEIRAGDWKPSDLPIGEVLRIATGGAIPGPGTEVVMLEDTVEDSGKVRLLRRGGDHIRRQGDDAKTGEVLIRAGTTLTDGCIALLASVGCTKPLVTRKLRARHIVTGNEIIDPAHFPSPGQIRDANSSLVAAWSALHRLELRQHRVGENAEELRAGMDGAEDLYLISGGASVGRYDFTEQVLRETGFTLLVTKVNARPGKPLLIARRGEQWAFGLPGNPLSHFVCLHVFVAAAVASMHGGALRPELLQGTCLDEVAGNPRETWWPADIEISGLRPLRWASSGDITSLARTRALLRVPSFGLAVDCAAEFIRTT
jgi:molybdopterin molybdotransferase